MKLFARISLLFIVVVCGCSSEPYKEPSDLSTENLKGKVKSVSLYQGGSLISKTDFNPQGFRTNAVFFNATDGAPRNEIVYEYENGWLMRETTTFPGNKDYKKVFERKPDGKIIRELSIYPGDEIDMTIEYEYNSDNQVSKKKFTASDGSNYCFNFDYDDKYREEIHCTFGLKTRYELSNGLVTRKTEYSQREVFYDYKYEYNEQKDRTLEVISYLGKEKERNVSTYDYDEQNNWISQTTDYSGKGKSEIKRTIEYY